MVSKISFSENYTAEKSKDITLTKKNRFLNFLIYGFKIHQFLLLYASNTKSVPLVGQKFENYAWSVV